MKDRFIQWLCFSQWVRYGLVSVIATTVSMSVLGTLVFTRTVSAGWANVIATCVATVPSFELNRLWVWRRSGSRSVGAEVVPFALLSLCGLGLSTLAVHVAAGWADDSHLSGSMRTLTVEAANLSAFGSLWVVQFVLLDRVLFRAPVPASKIV
jgi:putative flippase GtrA